MRKYVAGTSDIAIGAGAELTLIQLVAGSSRPLYVIELSVSFDGTTGSDAPAEVEVARQADAGTATAATPLPQDPDDAAAAASFQHAFTAEPTKGDVLRRWKVRPDGGLLVVQFLPEERIVVPAGGRLGMTALAGAAVNADAYWVFTA